jgi:hypothetical protein
MGTTEEKEEPDPNQEEPVEAEQESGRAPLAALVIWMCGFFLLLAFLLWDSLVEVVRWLLA